MFFSDDSQKDKKSDLLVELGAYPLGPLEVQRVGLGGAEGFR